MAQIDRVLRSNLKLRHLQMLVALDQFRHLGRAAEFLSVTQPAVSKTLAEIESMFGLPLFERSTRGTEPTAAGASVVRFARSVLAGFDRTRDEIAAEASGAIGRTSVGAMVAATPVLLNLCMIAAAWLGAPQLAARGIEPIYAMAGGVMLGGVLQLAVQLPVLYRLGLLPRIGVSWRAVRAAWAEPGVRRILTLMAPALLGVGVAQISLMINTQIASYLTPGSVTWLFYADRLMEFPTSLLGVALGSVLMPQLSAAQAAGDNARYSSMLDWALRSVTLMAVPCAAALLTFSRPIVSVLYQHGAFQAHDVEQTTQALMGYGTGLVGLIAIKILAPAYYARQDIKTPVYIAIGVLIATQLMNLAFVPLLAAGGGYPFKQKADGSFDASDTGVNNAGALKGVELLNKLLRDKVDLLVRRVFGSSSEKLDAGQMLLDLGVERENILLDDFGG